MREFNRYDFDVKDNRQKMRYVVVRKGDLDINGAVGYKTKKELVNNLEEDWFKETVHAIFKVEDITRELI